MSEPKFHTIDPEAIKNISIEQIQSQHHQVLETADYTIAVRGQMSSDSESYAKELMSYF
ncbi:hypothetical protein H6G27_32145 [Nostoc linckia FACHB-104]|nr:hypothetical protein [Nostoc linckia FACHB-104]